MTSTQIPLTSEMCRLMMHLAYHKAERGVRGLVLNKLEDFSKATIDGCLSRGVITAGERKSQRTYFLSSEGRRKVESWVNSGLDESGLPLSSQWRARLRPRYWNED